jgi:hypothetical protein
MKLGVEMRGYNEEMVKAEEVEEKARWIMASEGGKALTVSGGSQGAQRRGLVSLGVCSVSPRPGYFQSCNPAGLML